MTGLDPERKRRQALALTTAFLALLSIVGFALYGLPYFYDFFVKDLHWTRAQVTSGNAYSKITVGLLFGFLAGTIVDRFGPRRLMMFGIIIAGAALIGLGGVQTFAGFYFFYSLNALGYVCGGPLPNQVLLSRWFEAGRGKAMGIAYLGIGVGGAVVPALSFYLVQSYGWRTALRVLGALMILLALPMAAFVKEPPPDGTAKGAPGGAAEGSILDVLRQPAFYLLAFGSMCSIGAVGGTMQNLKLYLSLDRAKAWGLEPSGAQALSATVLSVILFSSIGGRLFMGWLADRWPRKTVMLLIYSIVAATIPLMIFAPSRPLLLGAAVLFGIGLGGDYMIIPLMAADLFGLKRMGRVMGVVLTADGVAEALVPMGVAAVRDQTASYALGFSALTVLAALGAIAIAFLPVRPPATR
jgi:MFS family permease